MESLTQIALINVVRLVERGVVKDSLKSLPKDLLAKVRMRIFQRRSLLNYTVYMRSQIFGPGSAHGRAFRYARLLDQLPIDIAQCNVTSHSRSTLMCWLPRDYQPIVTPPRWQEVLVVYSRGNVILVTITGIGLSRVYDREQIDGIELHVCQKRDRYRQIDALILPTLPQVRGR